MHRKRTRARCAAFGAGNPTHRLARRLSPRVVRVRTPIAPVLHDARASSVQETQILYGHCAEVRATEGRWLRVRGGDGYEGWMHEGFCEQIDTGSCEEWGWEVDGDLSMGCSMRDSRGVTIDLPLGAILQGGHCTSGRSIDLVRRREIFPAEASAVVASATGLFQGTYYQWGGVTPWGADCSGMVQTVFALHGVKLLRDAWQQATQGVHVEGGLEAIQPGDLLFFSDREDGSITHVALTVAQNRAVHLALGRGGHCIESLDRPDEYVKGLIGNFRFARRILARTA
jgi:hypothetical protein